jgi:hypothetical protein
VPPGAQHQHGDEHQRDHERDRQQAYGRCGVAAWRLAHGNVDAGGEELAGQLVGEVDRVLGPVAPATCQLAAHRPPEVVDPGADHLTAAGPCQQRRQRQLGGPG